MVDPTVLYTLGGFLGGLIRGVVGLLKWRGRPRRGKFRMYYLLATIIASGMIGIFASIFVEGDFRFSLLAGYAGTDFIESIYKLRFRQIYRK